MQIQITDLQFDGPEGLREQLIALGFGLVEYRDPFYDATVESVRIWTENDEGGNPQGFEVGMVRRDFGSFPKYTLTLDDARIGRARLGELLLSILEENVRA